MHANLLPDTEQWLLVTNTAQIGQPHCLQVFRHIHQLKNIGRTKQYTQRYRQTNQGIKTNRLLHHFSGHITLSSTQILRDHHTRTNADEIKQRNTDIKDLVTHRQCGNGLIRNMADHKRIQRRRQKMQRQIDE